MANIFKLSALPDLSYGSSLDTGYLMIFSGFSTIDKNFCKHIFSHFGKTLSLYAFDDSGLLIVRYCTPGAAIAALQCIRGQIVNSAQVSIFLDSTTTAELKQFCLVYRRKENSELTLSDVQVIQPLSESFKEAVDKIRYELFQYFRDPQSYSLPTTDEEDRTQLQIDDTKIAEAVAASTTRMSKEEVNEIISEILAFRKGSLQEYILAKAEKEQENLIQEVRDQVLLDLSVPCKSRR